MIFQTLGLSQAFVSICTKRRCFCRGWARGSCSCLAFKSCRVFTISGPYLGMFPPNEKFVGVFESLHISRMPLSAKERVQLVHTWCYPVLQVTTVAFYPSRSVLVRLRAALRVAFGSRNWKLTLDILHLPPSDGALGLWMPEVYLYSTCVVVLALPAAPNTIWVCTA